MKDIKKQILLAELIQKELDGCLMDQEFSLLQSMLKEDSEAVNYYVKTMRAISAFSANSIAPSVQPVEEGIQAETFQSGIWKALADAEKEAPAVEIPLPEAPRILIEKVQHQRVIRKISRGSLFTLFTAAAAILLIFVFVRFAPPQTGVKVAVLADSINAKWADMSGAMEKGAPVFTSRENFMLREGIIELLFDNQAKIVIESPAEFTLLSADQIKLQYGRVYAVVPREAIGFSIHTPTARIIDLGTEFGVSADISGDASLYVMQGRTTLIAGEKSSKVSMEVNAGGAKKVSGITQAVSDITFHEDLFVRNIDSQNNSIWKGQNQISLADIVGGGNGLGTGQVNTGVDPVTGQKAKSVFKDKNVTNEYHPVPSNSFIDGVFVPNGRTEQVVSSMRHVFQECPVTSGIFYTGIINTPVTAGKEWVLAGLKSNSELMAEVKSDSMETYPCILMHANLGITFDLQAIRSMLPNSKITCFRSPFGLAPLTDSMFNADFWVLVDGKLKFKQTQVNERGRAGLIDIELSDTDRFLTLVITDGGDPKEGTVRIQTPIYGDWCVFMEPVLVLE